MKYKSEYVRWIKNIDDDELLLELKNMDESAIEDAFYRNLAFGTGGLRGVIGAGTNRMNIYVVAKASQGLAEYLQKKFSRSSIVIGYDSRIKSDEFAKVAAGVFAANGIEVYIWSELTPVPTVSFAVRSLKASAGVMITASHNPSRYNGYKVYGSDGCQITTKAAQEILSFISSIDIFSGVKKISFDNALSQEKIHHINNEMMDNYIEAVKSQSVLFGDNIDRSVAIVYSPLNGTGLKPITRVLSESGFTNITIVDEQKDPDGDFPTCPYPNPEIHEAMELGVDYCRRSGADLLLATDPDADRCGIAVKSGEDYRLLSGNEVGLLLLDYICSQRIAHNRMPLNPIFVKTIVTMDLSEKIAENYGVETIDVLTGFKFIGEIIGKLEAKGRENDYICGFEESYGYLTGSYVRDKDAVNAAFMISEMFAFYKTRGITLIEKLEGLYSKYGFCLNTLHSYEFDGASGMDRINKIMKIFRTKDWDKIDYINGINDLPSADVLKFIFPSGSVVIRPSGTEPKVKVYISITASDRISAITEEKHLLSEIEKYIKIESKE